MSCPDAPQLVAEPTVSHTNNEATQAAMCIQQAEFQADLARQADKLREWEALLAQRCAGLLLPYPFTASAQPAVQCTDQRLLMHAAAGSLNTQSPAQATIMAKPCQVHGCWHACLSLCLSVIPDAHTDQPTCSSRTLSNPLLPSPTQDISSRRAAAKVERCHWHLT